MTTSKQPRDHGQTGWEAKMDQVILWTPHVPHNAHVEVCGPTRPHKIKKRQISRLRKQWGWEQSWSGLGGVNVALELESKELRSLFEEDQWCKSFSIPSTPKHLYLGRWLHFILPLSPGKRREKNCMECMFLFLNFRVKSQWCPSLGMRQILSWRLWEAFC